MLLVLLLGVTLGRPLPVLAHAVLLRSDPPDLCGVLAKPPVRPGDSRCASGALLAMAPTAVHLWFSQPAQPFAGGISVVDPSGRRIERGPVRADGVELSVDVDAGEEGTYVVRWRVVADDTHPALGSFAFSLGHVSAHGGTPSSDTLGSVPRAGLALQVAARFLHFAGAALGFGSLAFLLLILRPQMPAGAGRAGALLQRLAGFGVVVLLAAEVLALLAQTASLAGGNALDPAAVGDALSSSFGRVLAQRVAIALLLWMLVGVTDNGVLHDRAGRLALGLGALMAVVDTEASHIAGPDPSWPGAAATTIHVAAMAVWAGGLVALLGVWRLLERSTNRDALLRRFGRLAALCLALLVATGAVMTLLRLKVAGDLSSTAYGRTLVVKLAMVAAAVLLAYAGRRAMLRRRLRWWSMEAASLAAVLVLAGLLVSLPPPR